jgi:glycosyltransferase involved in cell wall biosynthesis
MRASVVIPAHNRAHTLRRAIESVLSQTETDYELLVVDDRSTDVTEQLVRGYSDVVYVANKHRRGPAGARNQGIEAASGEYVAFLDSDDEWSPNHLGDSLSCLESHRLDACYALWYRERGSSWVGYPAEWLDIVVHDQNMEVAGSVILLGTWIAEYSISKPFWCFHTDTLVAKRNAIIECGMFNENLNSAEDLEFSFRLLLRSHVGLIKDYHAYYYEGDDNIVALRTEDLVKLRRHHAEMVKAFKYIVTSMESSPLIVDKERCRQQLRKKIDEYEVLR